MSDVTTVEIFTKNHAQWRHWCKKLGMTSARVMEAIMEQPDLESRKKLYAIAGKAPKFAKVLKGKRIDKNHRNK